MMLGPISAGVVVSIIGYRNAKKALNPFEKSSTLSHRVNFCANCGTLATAGAIFCEHCGKHLC
jgi:hypothetical protein